jgi:hypothetical protein
VEAERVGAIGADGLTVPGSTQPPWLAVQFEYGRHELTRGDGVVLDDGTVPKLRVSVHVQKRLGDWGRPVIEVIWTSGMTSDEVGEALATQLKHRDRLEEGKVFDFPLSVRELQRGLKLALDDQRTPPGKETLHGALNELISTDWVITSYGVENLHTGLRLTAAELGFSRGSTSKDKVSSPNGVSAEEWSYVTYRAGQRPARGIF